jgi:hypothetical protein
MFAGKAGTYPSGAPDNPAQLIFPTHFEEEENFL